MPYPAIFGGCQFFDECHKKHHCAAGESGGGAASPPQWGPGAKPWRIFANLHSE